MKFGVGQILLLALCLAYVSENTLATPQTENPPQRRGQAGQRRPNDPRAIEARRRMAAAMQKKAADQKKAEEEKKSDDDKTSQPEKPPKPAGPITAYVGAEIHTVSSSGVIENGTLLVQDGRILDVGGSELKVPEAATRVDVGGHVLTPGLIDARSKLWLTSAASSSSASDGSLNVLDGIDPYSDYWNEVISEGVTSVYIQPNGTLGGYGAVISVAPKPTAAEETVGPEVLKDFAALQASIGKVSDNRARKQQLDRTDKVLKAAADYKKQWDAYRKYQDEQAKKKKEDAKSKDAAKPKSSTTSKASPPARSRTAGRVVMGPNGRPIRVPARPPSGGATAAKTNASSSTSAKPEAKKDEEKKPPKKPEKDPAKERLLKVLDGKIPLRLEVQTADDVHYAMELLKKHPNLQVIYEGLSNLRSAGEKITSTGSPVVYGPWLGVDARLENPDSAAWINEVVSYEGSQAIATYATSNAATKMLRAHAARAVSAGMDPEKALKSISLDAARLLGLGSELGSIEKGKRADFVCFTGNPVNLSNAAKLVVSGGEVVFEDKSESPSSSIASAESDVQMPASESFALKGHVLQKDGSVETQTILVEAGKIVSVLEGKAKLDSKYELVDLGTSIITPGLFSAHSNFQQQSNLDPSSTPDASFVSVVDAIPATFANSKRLAKSGILRAAIAPGNANPIAGSTSVIRLGLSSDSVSDFVAHANSASKFVLAQAARNPNRFPSSLAGQLQMINSSLDGVVLTSRIYLPQPIAGRLQKAREDAMQRVATGESVAVFEAQTDAEISAALNLIERRKLKAAILAPSQIEPFIERLVESGTAIVCKPTSVSGYNWYEEDLAAASAAGVKILFSGESHETIRLTASRAVAAGMSVEAANASLCFGAEELYGSQSMEAGLPADFVVWNGMPTDLAAKPILVVVDGKEVD